MVRPETEIAAEAGEVQGLPAGRQATESAKPKVYEGVEVGVQIGPNATWIRAEADGGEVFEGLVAAGVNKTFQAEEKVLLRTGNAGSTKVFVNGVKQESLGKEGEVAEREYTR